MKIAIIGGGTAGHLAAAHMSHFFPDWDLVHIYDPRIAPIGVGEGTLPGFKVWLDSVTAAPFAQLVETCQATLKQGVRFEGWGSAGRRFQHSFSAGQHAYHLSAARLPGFLQSSIRATLLEKHVAQLHSTGRLVDIHFSDGTVRRADFVFDATGFPSQRGMEQLTLDGIPTNAALVYRSATTSSLEETRAVARPHGWIFVIPLTTSTSYGYVFNGQISQEQEIRADMRQFFREEGIPYPDQERLLRFPSFVQRQPFDGALFRIGNAASFLEPLEATAIAITLEQLRVASLWLADGLPGIGSVGKWDPGLLERLNRHIRQTVQAVALFVSWHYACGSQYDTPFWRYARARFAETIARYRNAALLADFQRFVEAGATVPAAHLDCISDPHLFEQDIRPNLTVDGELGGFAVPSFAQVGHGLGYYEELDEARPTIHRKGDDQ